MSAIVLVISIEDGDRSFSGNHVMIGDTSLGYRPFDGSYCSDIASEIEGAFASLLRRELQAMYPSSKWAEHQISDEWDE